MENNEPKEHNGDNNGTSSYNEDSIESSSSPTNEIESESKFQKGTNTSTEESNEIYQISCCDNYDDDIEEPEILVDIPNSEKLGESCCEEFTIDVPWGIIAGKWWGSRNKQPILALHGWQDNCGSFDRLCPLLTKTVAVLAIDLPGHGKSTHYPKGMQYFIFWDGICVIRRIVRKFNWQNVTLLGHSLGGALTFMYASCFPNDVKKLINIDIAGPTVRNIKTTAAATGHALDKFLDYETLPESKQPCYSYDEMIALVLHAYEGSVDKPSVEILMRRGMIENGNGYMFARDLRLKVSLLGMFTLEQTVAYASQIRCKVLNIRAISGLKSDIGHSYDEVINTLKGRAKLVVYIKVHGTHHVHLVKPDRVAPHINYFLLNQ